MFKHDGFDNIGRPARRFPKLLGTAWASWAIAISAQAQAQPPPLSPGPFAPPSAVVDPAAIPALSQATVVDVRKLVEMVRLELDVSPAGQQLGARVNVLLGTADNFNRAIVGNMAPPRQFEALVEMHRAHQLVSAGLSQPAVAVEAPGSVRMGQRIGTRIEQIRSSFPAPGPMPGPGPAPQPAPGPGPMPGPPREVLLHRVLTRELTGLISEVDLFVGGLNPKVPEGPQLQGEAVALQNALRNVRRDFNRPRPEPVLVSDFNHAVGTHRVLAARVERLNRGRAGPNVQRVRNIGATLARIQQAVPGL